MFRIIRPSLNINVTAKANYARLKALLDEFSDKPTALLIGGGESLGYGIEKLGEDTIKRAVNLDVFTSPSVDIVGDGQYLPFSDSSFDCVIAHAVVCYFEEPRLGAREMYRVLKPGGYVFVDVPFLQAYLYDATDYYRFTLPGLNMLFSDFQIIHSGISCGPSSALSMLLSRYLPIVFSFGSDTMYKIGLIALGWLVSPLKYLDVLLAKNKNVHTIASGVSLIARKPDHKEVGQDINTLLR